MPFQNVLQITNVTFVASKNNKVLDFNLTIKNEGDIICLLGPSGIGKTTILRSIAGLQKIVKGKIILKGVTLSSEKRHIEPERRKLTDLSAYIKKLEFEEYLHDEIVPHTVPQYEHP